MNIEIIHDTEVSEDREKCCAYPQAAVLGDRKIVVVYRRGETKHSFDGTLIM